MRLEANISLRKVDQTELPPYKVEVKNINSFRYLEQAISFEVQRQALELMDGRQPRQETRGWDSVNNVTFPQRSKEDAEDYRYFPDPDIPPIHITEELLNELRASLTELPAIRSARWHTELGIEERYSQLLFTQSTPIERYEQLFSAAKDHQLDSNKLANLLVNKKIVIKDSDTIDSILSTFETLTQVDTVETSEITSAIQTVMAANPTEVSSYRAGKTQVINFFLGQVMRQLGKKVEAQVIKTELEKQLSA